jgi:hypothetical protein
LVKTVLPVPRSEPIVSLLLTRNVAPELVTTAVSAMARPLVSANVPALIVVSPVYELDPESVTVPLPLLVREPTPRIAPA